MLRETKDRTVYRAARACGTKRTYASIREADRGKPPGQSVYICPFCGLYHRTSSPLSAPDERAVQARLAAEASRESQPDPEPRAVSDLQLCRWSGDRPPLAILVRENGEAPLELWD